MYLLDFQNNQKENKHTDIKRRSVKGNEKHHTLDKFNAVYTTHLKNVITLHIVGILPCMRKMMCGIRA